MKASTPRSDAILLIRFASVLWIVYLFILAIINQSLAPPNRGAAPIYYLLHGSVALVCLGLAYFKWPQDKLGRAFVPIIIGIVTVFPILASYLSSRFFPLGPQFYPDDPVLRLLPFGFIALVLTAWQYSWEYMLLIVFATAGLNLALLFATMGPGAPPFRGGLSITLIQTLIFLAVGSTISYLVHRLKAQQRVLEAANIRLMDHAATLEQLATSRERNRLALELHDTLAHTLSGLSVQLETIKAYWDIEPATARSLLEKSLTSTHLGLDETRRALKSLRAGSLEDLGLMLAVRKLAEDAAARAGLTLDMPEVIMMPALSPDVEQCVYRVAQEAITNVVKHAGAKKLSVRLESFQGQVSLAVRDDGTGFDAQKIDSDSHFGLAGMAERARMIDGRLSVVSEPGRGTEIKLTAPAGART